MSAGGKNTGTERTALGAAPARLPFANSSSQIPARCWPEIGWIFLIISLLTIPPHGRMHPAAPSPPGLPLCRGAQAPGGGQLPGREDAGGDDDDDDGDSSLRVPLPIRRGKSMWEGRVGSRPESPWEALKVRALHGASKGEPLTPLPPPPPRQREQPCWHLLEKPRQRSSRGAALAGRGRVKGRAVPAGGKKSL